MKNIKLASLLVLFITVFTFTSCDNEPIDDNLLEDFPNTPGGNTGGAFTAKIAGANFSANGSIMAELSDSAFGPELNVIGADSNGKIISFQIINPVIGTRTGNGTMNTLLLFQYFASVNDQYSSINNTVYNGTMTITDFNLTTNKISGTFSFTGYGTLSSTAQVEITQGTFTNISFENNLTTVPTPTPTPTTLVGSYLLTAFNTSVPTDLNGDGTASTNQINETSCLANSLLTLNANNTFSSDSKGIDIELDLNTGASTIECYDDPPITGTWSLSGNQLTFSYIDEGVPTSDVFTVSGNTLSYTVQSGQVVGTASGGEPVYLTSDITLIYTKQ